MTDLVLIPGLGSDAAVWSRCIDQFGHGFRSTVGDTLHDDTLEGMARRILKAAPATFVLAGLSMGGMVALEIMRLQPERVTGLAIVDSNPFPDTHEQAEQRRRILAAIRNGIDLRASGQAGLTWLIHPDAAADVKAEIVEMGVRVGAEAYARQVEAVLHRADQQPILASIRVPTLVVTGANDAMIPVSCARAIAASVPNAELEIIPDCGHLPPIEKPQAVAGLLRDLASRK